MPPIAMLAVAAIGAGVSAYGASQGAAAQKESMQAQQRMDNLKAARERTQQVRQSRAARADIEQRGANQGGTMSSSVQTGAAGVSQQAFSNEQYIGYQQQTGNALATADQKRLNAEGVSAIGNGVSDIGMTAFNNRKELGDIFSGSTS